MEYPRQLDLPFDNKEVLNVSYGRELQQSIDRLTFCARDVYKNSKILLDLAEEVLEVAKRNHDNKDNRNIITKGSYEVKGILSTIY